MRPILRFIWATLINLALLAMALVIWLWIRSYGGADGVSTNRPLNGQTILVTDFVSYRGAIRVARIEEQVWYWSAHFIYVWRAQTPDQAVGHALPPRLAPSSKFDFKRETTRLEDGIIRGAWVASMPHWLVLAVLAHLPAAAVWSAYRQRRRGNCTRCGARAPAGACARCGATRSSMSHAARRWVGGFLAGASLLAFLAIAAAWIAAQFMSIDAGVSKHLLDRRESSDVIARRLEARTTTNSFEIYHQRVDSEPPSMGERYYALRKQTGSPLTSNGLRLTANADRVFSTAGLGIWKYDAEPHPHELGVERKRVVIVPYWMPLCLLAMLPAIELRRRLRDRRQRTRRLRGLCERCGYDLRASPALCPECGHAPQLA